MCTCQTDQNLPTISPLCYLSHSLSLKIPKWKTSFIVPDLLERRLRIDAYPKPTHRSINKFMAYLFP